MFVSFIGPDADALLNNLDLSLDEVKRQIVYSPAAEPGVRDPDRFFINLHCLRQNIDALLATADFTER